MHYIRRGGCFFHSNPIHKPLIAQKNLILCCGLLHKPAIVGNIWAHGLQRDSSPSHPLQWENLADVTITGATNVSIIAQELTPFLPLPYLCRCLYCTHPSIVPSIYAPDMLHPHPLHRHGINCNSTTQSTVTVSPQLYPYHCAFMFTLLTLCLHHLIITYINASISILKPLPWYPVYQCHCHHNHCCSTTASVSIKL